MNRLMMTGPWIAVLLLGELVSAAARAEPSGPIVAVFNIQAKGVPLTKATQARLSDYLAARLAASGSYQVVPRDALRKRLLEQKKQSYKACYDSACQIELGRELAAQKSLSTQVLKIVRGRCIVTATLYDLKKAASERGATAEGGCSVESIKASIDNVVRRLRRVEGPPAQKEKKPSGGVAWIETKGGSQTLPADFDPSDFDALGFLPRAQKLARQRMEDAVLVDFDVEGVYPDGRVDLTLNEAYRANYYFRSISRSRGDPSLPANVEQEIECLVYVEVSSDRIEVFNATSIENCKEKPRPRWRCSLKEAWELARQRGAPTGNLVAKVSWLWDGWYFDFGEGSLGVPDDCDPDSPPRPRSHR